MKKGFKLTILIIFVLLLCGCSVKWEDVYTKKTKPFFDSGAECAYKINGEAVRDLKTIKFRASSKGLYVSYNDKDEITLINSKDKNNFNHYFLGESYSYQRFQLNDYLNDFMGAGTCPSKIYINVEPPTFFVLYNCNVQNGCAEEYVLYSSSTKKPIGNEEEEEVFDTSCQSKRAINCKDYHIYDNRNKLAYVQLGRQKTTDGKIRNYIVVSYKSDYSDTQPAYYNESTKQLYTVVAPSEDANKYGSKYFYMEEAEMNKIFIGEDSYIDTLYVFHEEAMNVLDEYYYLRSYDDGGSYGSTDLENQDDVETDFKYCSEVGVLKTFRIVGYLIFIIKILVPLLLIIFGSIDFAKAIISDDTKAINASAILLAKRAAAGIIIFFIPAIIEFATSLISSWSDIQTDFWNCHRCLFDTTECTAIIDSLSN